MPIIVDPKIEKLVGFLADNVSKDGLIQIRIALDKIKDKEMPEELFWLNDVLLEELGEQCPRCAKFEAINKGCNIAETTWDECGNCGEHYNQD